MWKFQRVWFYVNSYNKSKPLEKFKASSMKINQALQHATFEIKMPYEYSVYLIFMFRT